jgi:N-acyl amino acid synthase of PEP-CTERM/exosortase system
MDTKLLINTYSKYFFVTLANTPALREAAYQIRYQVYCREFHYEKEEDCPDGKERDEYDSQSLHCLLIHKPTRTPTGCIRLIFPNPANLALPLPFERHCKHSLDPNRVNLDSLDRRYVGEFSRLAVLSEFRRRKSDQRQCISLPDPQVAAEGGRADFPLVSLSLLLASSVLLFNSGLQFVFSMIEPKLARGLRYYGIPLIQVGNAVDYHGFRGPFLLAKETALTQAKRLSPRVRALLEAVAQQMAESTLENIA